MGGAGYGELREGTDPSDVERNYERQYDTPDHLIQKAGGSMPQDILDMELGLNTKERKAFTREDFRLMINKTYSEYYGKFRD